MPDTINTRRKFAIIAVFIFISLYFAYLPVLQMPYLAHDEYFMTLPGEFEDIFGYTLSDWMNSIGRPLGGIAHDFVSTSVLSMEDTTTMRLVNVVIIALTSLIVAGFLMSRQISWYDAGLIGVIGGCLTPFQVGAGYFSALYALCGYLCSSAAGAFLLRSLLHDKPFARVGSLVAGLALFVAALCFYQPTAFMVYAFCIVPLLSDPNDFGTLKAWLKRLALLTVFLLICAFVYLLIWRRYVSANAIELSSSYNPSITVDSPAARLTWFLKNPLVDALSLFRIRGSIADYAGIALIAILGIPLSFASRGKASFGAAGVMAVKCCLIALILVASISPVLASGNPYGALRYQGVLSLAALMLVSTTFLQFGRILKKPAVATLFLAFTAFSAAVEANHNVMLGFALPNTMEYRHMKNAIALQTYNDTTVTGARIILAVRPDQFSGRRHYDEFGLAASVAPVDAPAMARWAFKELGIDTTLPIRLLYQPRMSWEFPRDAKYVRGFGQEVDSSAILIDMRVLPPNYWGEHRGNR